MSPARITSQSKRFSSKIIVSNISSYISFMWRKWLKINTLLSQKDMKRKSSWTCTAKKELSTRVYLRLFTYTCANLVSPYQKYLFVIAFNLVKLRIYLIIDAPANTRNADYNWLLQRRQRWNYRIAEEQRQTRAWSDAGSCQQVKGSFNNGSRPHNGKSHSAWWEWLPAAPSSVGGCKHLH